MTTHHPTTRFWRMTALAVAASLALSACPNQNAKRQEEINKKMKSVEPTVSVLTVQPEEMVTVETDLPGRIESLRTADIVPQISGIVKQRLFEEGSIVRKGQHLYRIDDAAYRATLQGAEANLLTAKAALAKAQADLARYRPLVQADAISKQEWDAAVTAERSADAQVQAAQASINAAKVNLNHTDIIAPIGGLIGQSLVDEGTLVTANNTKMASIQQNDPMYINITQSSGDVLKLQQQIRLGQKVLNQQIPVNLVLEDGTTYSQQGHLLFTDPKVDKTTGQITIRAVIRNPEQLLISGMYVRVKLPLTSVPNAYLIPQQAVTRGQTDTVNLVDSNGKITPRTVKIVGQKDNYWIINEGLNTGDKVVMDGTMIAGMLKAAKVKTKEWQPTDAHNSTSVSKEEQHASAPSTPASAASQAK